MSMLEAARMGDKVAHTRAWEGFIKGMILGAVLAVGIALLLGATLLSGGLATAVIVGALLAGAGSGALAGMEWGAGKRAGAGDPIKTGASRTFIGRDRMPAARAKLDEVTCDAGMRIAQGSKTVAIEMGPAARRTDMTECGGKIDEGWSNVFIGKEADTYVKIIGEVPEEWIWAAYGAIAVGSLLSFGAAWAITGSFLLTAAGTIGSIAVGQVLGWAGNAVGNALFGRDGGIILGYLGAEVGGLLGGHLSTRGAISAARARLSGRPDLAARIAQMPGRGPTSIAARQMVAENHYRATRTPYTRPGDTPRQAARRVTRDIRDQMSGIDFREPVMADVTGRNSVLYTFNKPGAGTGAPGQYFTEVPTEPSRIGIAPFSGTRATSKELYTVVPAEGTPILRSTASPKIDGWSVDGARLTSRGGADQINLNHNTRNNPGSSPFALDSQGRYMTPTTPGTAPAGNPADTSNALRPGWARGLGTPIAGDAVHPNASADAVTGTGSSTVTGAGSNGGDDDGGKP